MDSWLFCVFFVFVFVSSLHHPHQKKKKTKQKHNKPTPPNPHTHMASLRDRQVQNLQHYFPSIVTIAPDCYDIPFKIVTRPQTNFTLRVLFPRLFPQDPPKFQLWPRSSPSSLIDESGFVRPVSLKGLKEWNSGSSLGLVAFEMIKLFEVQPPSPLGVQPQPQSHYASRPFQSMPDIIREAKKDHHKQQHQPQHQQQHQPQHQPQQQQPQQPQPDLISKRPTIPPVPDTFPELSSLSLQEMESLLNDEKEFNAFFSNLPTVNHLNTQHQQLQTTNTKIAQQTLELYEIVQTSQQEVKTKQKELLKTVEEFKEKEKIVQKEASSHSPEGLMEKLERYVREAEERTEGLGEKFEEGEIDCDEFLKNFVKEREMYHTLAAKKESLELFMMHQESSS